MGTECYALVRGSAIRVTGLDRRGHLPAEATDIQYAVAKAVARVVIDEVVEPGGNDVVRNHEDERRLHLVTSDQTVGYVSTISFLRTDPGLLALMTGVPLAYNAVGDIVGFDGKTKLPAQAFALEVWSKMVGAACADGVQRWGYTVLPFLKGGVLSGFTFANGLVSFNLTRAATQRGAGWGAGPYFVDGWCRPEPVSGNLAFRQTLTTFAPPEPTNGVVPFLDEIDGGTASMTTPDDLDGGTAYEAGPCEIDGGAA